MTRPCLRCRRTHPSKVRGRGLCRPCHRTVWRQGTLLDYPRLTRSRADVLADYLHLREDGHSLRQIAERMGMQYGSLCRALQRARRAGAL
jgi:transposase-like protein